MKKQNLTKFALSIVCAAVLSACGGSSSSTDTTTTPAPSAEQTAINNLVTKATAANTAATLGLTEEQIKAFAAANYAQTFADDAALVEALKKFLADSTSSTSSDINYSIDVTKSAFTNLQIAQGNKSNLGQASLSNKVSDTLSFSQGDMKLHRSFDTIVVATNSSNRDKGLSVYLEDFHFDSANSASVEVTTYSQILANVGSALLEVVFASDVASAKTSSAAKLTQLKTEKNTAETAAVSDPSKKQEALDAKATYELFKLIDTKVQATSSTTIDDLTKEIESVVYADAGKTVLTAEAKKAVEPTGKKADTDAGRAAEKTSLTGIYVAQATLGTGDTRAIRTKTTETETIGKKEGGLIRYQAGRRVYITAPDATKAAEMAYIDTTGATTTINNVRVLKDTVAEVYGNKTFTTEINAGNHTTYDRVNDGANNLPFFSTDKTTGDIKGGYLTRVQYGRVTSALSDVDLDTLKAGTIANTKVASYGLYGSEGTENHYFARGTDNISEANLKSFADSKAVLTYNGHAVSYGLENSYNGRPSGVPNAIGESYQLYSGNHVKATVDTGTGDVAGYIYNTWTSGEKNAAGDLLDEVKLVNFNGKINNLGNITGDAYLAYDEASKGKLAAAIYGQKAEELGGAVQSEDRSADKAWGAVFGAARVIKADNVEVQAGSPLNPRNQSTN